MSNHRNRCEVCGQAFSDKKELEKHENNHQEKITDYGFTPAGDDA